MPKLTALAVRKLGPGRHADGRGLYLFVRPNGSRSWTLRWSRDGKPREMGLGNTDVLTLAEAREAALEAQRDLHRGVDPIDARRQVKQSRAAETGHTFERVAELFIASHQAGWRSAKHGDQWRATLKAYAFPTFGQLPVSAIDTGLIMRAIEPIWREKPETASRTRGRVEAVLDYATARGWRQGDNPARWRGHLAHMLPARAKVAAVQHHAAVPWREVSNVMAALESASGVGALATRFACLTAARSMEARGATWAEIDLAENVWTVPAERMKGGRPHRVPLSDDARDVLEQVRPLAAKPTDLVFPGGRARRPLSDVALSKALHAAAGTKGVTVHGLRSTFRDWAADHTAFPREIAESALAHINSDRVEAAYRRGDALEQRRRLMSAWADHCAQPVRPIGEVVPIRQAVSA